MVCLESADFRVLGWENSKYKAQDRTQHIFWAIERIQIFFREYPTFTTCKKSEFLFVFPMKL